MAKTSVCVAFLVFLLIQNVQCRSPKLNSSELVSDGLNNIYQSPFLELKRLDSSTECEHMYGFLPCTKNLAGHIFQIVFYIYLMFTGETYVSYGSELLYKILGAESIIGRLFGASVFHVLGALPEAIILVVSGLSNSKETAQERVLSGVGVLSGSTIFLLTFLWGTCVIVGNSKFTKHPIGEADIENATLIHSQQNKYSSFLTGSGIETDWETSKTARIMVLSVIPFIIVQLPAIFSTPSWGRIIVMTSLVTSVAFLFGYFLYQVLKPWIPMRRLEYAKTEHLMADILTVFQRLASGKLLTSQGAPNQPVIKKLFATLDHDVDHCITQPELQKVIPDIKPDVLEVFDQDHDNKITEKEFLKGFEKLNLKSKHAIEKQDSYSKDNIESLFKQRIIEITSNEPRNGSESLFTDDVAPTVNHLKWLFETFDHDGDNCISFLELKELIHRIEFGKMELSSDEVIALLMKKLDKDGDEKINEQEFVLGFSDLFSSVTTLDDIYQEAWKATDKVLESKDPLWTCLKSIVFLLLGTAIVSMLAEPLIDAVHNFSNAANIPSFYASFILVPWAINSREAVAAIKAVRSRKPRTTSLTFSEIYGGVIINNVLGLSVLLSLVFFQGLTWNFSAEVLVIIIICVVMGVLGSLCRSYPVWTSSVAYFLYPFALVLVYVLDYVYGWS